MQPNQSNPEKCCKCDDRAYWQDGLHGTAIQGGKYWCGTHAVVHRAPGMVVPYYTEEELAEIKALTRKTNYGTQPTKSAES